MKPLDGIRIIDFSRVLAAPSATQALAELGAEVIKIERPGRGDETRQFEPRYPNGESGYYFAFNRGKRSVALDLKSLAGRDLARDLIRTSDVVVENFVPGTMEGLGLGYPEVSEDQPGLIYVSASGFGQSGPNRDEKGYDTIFQALSGIMASTGQPDGPPSKAGIPVSDLTSGLWVAIAVLTGLLGRALHGSGCAIDVSMMDVQFSLQALSAARIFALGEDPSRTGTEHPGRVPSAAFQASDGEWLHISASDQHWAPLCAALGLDHLGSDPALATNARRVADRVRIMAELTAAIAGRSRSDVVAALRAVEVPVGEVLSVKDALATPQSTEREVVQTFEHPVEGAVRALRTPLRMSGWDDPEVKTPPLLGADTDAVLRGVLGLDADRIRALREDGVVA